MPLAISDTYTALLYELAFTVMRIMSGRCCKLSNVLLSSVSGWMVGTIRYNNGVRSNSVMPAVAGVEQEQAILRCMSVGTVDVWLQKEEKRRE